MDDLHEYLRLSYPRLRPPSYFCDNENEFGLILHYRTKRNFLLWYTVGQIIKVAKVFYSTDVEIELISQNQEINEYHFILQLRFDNRVFIQRPTITIESGQRFCRLSPPNLLLNDARMGALYCPFTGTTISQSMTSLTPSSTSSSPIPTYSISPTDANILFSPITLEVFLEIFPFSVIYDSNMKIRQTGNCLKVIFT